MSPSIFLLALLLAFLSSIEGYHYDPVQHGFMKGVQDPVALDISTWDDSTDCSPPYIGNHTGLKLLDMIDYLPGQPDNTYYGQYSGYVTVDPDAGRALFYYFVESINPQNTPLLLWFNGGGNWEPHSSLAYGAIGGHGPYRVASDGETLTRNEYSWNQVANIIYLEVPAGVGFSYSNQSSDYDNLGDKKAVEDVFTFLVNWLERFPAYKAADFYIGGDGYAGHGIPLLARKIQESNACNITAIPLRSIAIGNGWMDEEVFVKGVYDYQRMHYLITDDIHEGITANCNFTYPFVLSTTCLDFLNQSAAMMANVNPYEVHSPLCNSSTANTITLGGFDVCSNLYAQIYFNRPEVQSAMHANTTGLTIPWNPVSPVIKQWKDFYPTVIPAIKRLLQTGIQILLYSGDTDAVVPITSTEDFLDNLQLPVQNSSYAWYAEGGVAGYAIGYENLTYATVRDGGHFISSYQPARALALMRSFLAGTLPPDSY